MELRSHVPLRSKRGSKNTEKRIDGPPAISKSVNFESDSALLRSKTENEEGIYPHRYLLRNNILKDGKEQDVISPLTLSPQKNTKRKNISLDSPRSIDLTKLLNNTGSRKKKRLFEKKNSNTSTVKKLKHTNLIDNQGHMFTEKNKNSAIKESKDQKQYPLEKKNNDIEDFKKKISFFKEMEECTISRDESSSKDTDSFKDEHEDFDVLLKENSNLISYEEALENQLSLSENPLIYTQDDSYLVTSQRISEALTVLNSNDDYVIQLLVLQNLAECLSVVSEDAMGLCSGKRALIGTLVQIIKGDSCESLENSFDCYSSVNSAERVTLACRCLCNLMESFPPILESIVKSGAINILVNHLNDIKSIELAEQIIAALKIISHDFPTIIVRHGGLIALLRNIDFYSTQVQRNTVIAVANCCKNVDVSYFDKFLEILPFVKNILNFSDIVVQEQICIIFANITRSFCLYPKKLELIFSDCMIESFTQLLRNLDNTNLDVKSHLNIITLLNIITKSSIVIAEIISKKKVIDIICFNIFGNNSPEQLTHSFILNISELIEKTLDLSNNLLPDPSTREVINSDTKNSFHCAVGFCSVMAPVTLKLFKVSSSKFIKLNCLTFIYKLSVFSDETYLKDILKDLSIGDFLASTAFKQDNALFLRSLQIIYCLTVRLPDLIIPIFSREGIFNELAKKPSKINKRKLDGSFNYCGLNNISMITKLKIGELNQLIDKNFKQLFNTFSSSAIQEFTTFGDHFINPLIELINSTYLEYSVYYKYKNRNPALAKLKAVARGIGLDNNGSNSQLKSQKSLMLLRDILFQNNLTTNELSSSKLLQYLQKFLNTNDKFCELSKDMFCDIFFTSEKGLISLKNFIFLLHSRIDSLEDYETIEFKKEPIYLRCFVQSTKITLIQDKNSSHEPHQFEIQLHEPTKLLLNHIMESLKEKQSFKHANMWDKYKIQLKYKDIILDENDTLLKSLIQCGITSKNICNTINLDYFKILRKEIRFNKEHEIIQEDSLKEFEIAFGLLRTICCLKEQYLNTSCDIHKLLPPELFINVKLTAKINSQLNEDLIVACNCIPEWCAVLINKFPFLFPITVKLRFLQATSFGADRLLTKIRDVNIMRQQERPLPSGDTPRCKICVSRQKLLKSAIKISESYSQSRSILEIQFNDEAGSGQGPTLEFFSCVFREFCRQDLGLWRHQDSPASDIYINIASGLFPRPRTDSEISKSSGKKTLQYFKTLGWITAKSLIDSRVVDIPLNKLFLELVIFKNEKHSLSQAEKLHMISLIDGSLANSLRCICAASKNDFLLKEMSLTFMLPGYNIQLEEKGAKTFVNASNVNHFLERVFDLTIGRGIQYALDAFEQGFNCIFPLINLRVFTLEELGTILGAKEEDWSSETIRSNLKADHGFSISSNSIIHLISILSNFSSDQKELFLQFITGSRKLPIGGFNALVPNLTVVKKQCDSPLIPDDYLPSVNTCFNYLKLPEYSSEEVMKKKLLTAIIEGKDSFHLS